MTWDEIESFGLEPVRTKLDGDLSKPAVRLRSGEVIRLVGVEPPGRPFGISSKPIVFAQLEELDRLARERRP